MVYRVGLRQFVKLRRRRLIAAGSAVSVCVVVTGLAYANTQLLQPKTLDKNLTAMQAATKQQVAGAQGRSGSAHGGATANTKSKAASKVADSAAPAIVNATCTGGGAMHSGLSSASSAQLRKLADYEKLCGSGVVSRLSFFVPTPGTTSEARTYAADAAAQLKEFSRYGVAPLVFMEPNDDHGLLDLEQYAAGGYDTALDAYYAQLKSAGVSDAMMGTWVLLPEGNLPEWSSVDPDTFAAVVARTAQLQKKYFPASQVSLMLDSETYPSANSWSGGAYVSLVPYVQNIPRGLVDSFGLQGFPWAAPAGQSGSVFDPATYLRTDLAMQAANALGVSNLWVNTGSFHAMYARQAGKTVTLTPLQRQAMLSGVVSQLRSVQAAGFTTAVHLFAENKANVSEGTDWSYWQGTPGEDDNSTVLSTFIHDVRAAGSQFWLYDAVH